MSISSLKTNRLKFGEGAFSRIQAAGTVTSGTLQVQLINSQRLGLNAEAQSKTWQFVPVIGIFC